MNKQSLALRAESAQLLTSALVVEAMAEVVDPSTAPEVLEDLEAAVAAMAGACEAMVATLSTAHLSHERLALLLAALRDAASSLRTASQQCRVAAEATRPAVPA